MLVDGFADDLFAEGLVVLLCQSGPSSHGRLPLQGRVCRHAVLRLLNRAVITAPYGVNRHLVERVFLRLVRKEL